MLENAEGTRIQPMTFIHEGERIANPEDPMGLWGTTMTALFSIRREQAVEEPPHGRLDRNYDAAHPAPPRKTTSLFALGLHCIQCRGLAWRQGRAAREAA